MNRTIFFATAIAFAALMFSSSVFAQDIEPVLVVEDAEEARIVESKDQCLVWMRDSIDVYKLSTGELERSIPFIKEEDREPKLSSKPDGTINSGSGSGCISRDGTYAIWRYSDEWYRFRRMHLDDPEKEDVIDVEPWLKGEPKRMDRITPTPDGRSLLFATGIRIYKINFDEPSQIAAEFTFPEVHRGYAKIAEFILPSGDSDRILLSFFCHERGARVASHLKVVGLDTDLQPIYESIELDTSNVLRAAHGNETVVLGNGRREDQSIIPQWAIGRFDSNQQEADFFRTHFFDSTMRTSARVQATSIVIANSGDLMAEKLAVENRKRLPTMLPRDVAFVDLESGKVLKEIPIQGDVSWMGFSDKDTYFWVIQLGAPQNSANRKLVVCRTADLLGDASQNETRGND